MYLTIHWSIGCWLRCQKRKTWSVPCARARSLRDKKERWIVNGVSLPTRSPWWSARSAVSFWVSQRDEQSSTSIKAQQRVVCEYSSTKEFNLSPFFYCARILQSNHNNPPNKTQTTRRPKLPQKNPQRRNLQKEKRHPKTKNNTPKPHTTPTNHLNPTKHIRPQIEGPTH